MGMNVVVDGHRRSCRTSTEQAVPVNTPTPFLHFLVPSLHLVDFALPRRCAPFRPSVGLEDSEPDSSHDRGGQDGSHDGDGGSQFVHSGAATGVK